MGQISRLGIWLLTALAVQLFAVCSCQNEFISVTRPRGGCPNYEEENLRPNTSYIVSTTTITPGQSGPDPPVVETFETDTVPFNTLRAWNIQTDEFSLYWQPSDQNEPGPFVIQAREGSILIEMEAASVTGLNDMPLRNLMPGTLYDVTLLEGSRELAMTAVLTRPRPISLLTLESASTNTLGLRWEHSPEIRPTDPLTYYEVCYHASGRMSELLVSSDNEIELRNLIPGTVYTISITVIVNRNGLSGASESVYRFFSTVSSTLPTTPESLDVTSLSPNSVRLSWDIPVGLFEAFEVEYIPQFGFPLSPIRIPPEQSSIELDNLMSSTDYKFSLMTTEGRKLSKVQSPPVETTFRTADGPFDVQVYNIRDTSAELLYGVEPTASRYRITYFIMTRHVVDQLTQSADIPRLWRIYNLMPDTTYLVIAAALDDEGSIITENATTFKTLLPALGQPTVTQYTATTASISLPVPEMDFDHYLVQVHFGGDGGFGAEIGSLITVDRSPCPTLDLDNLRPDSLYEIVASIIVGDTSTVATAEGLNTRPLGPTEIGINSVSTTRVELIWQEGVGVFENYQLLYLSDSAGGGLLSISSNATRYVLTNLQPSTVYRVTLVQMGGTQNSRMTEFATRPSTPTNLRFSNIKTQSSDVTWDSSHTVFEFCHNSSSNIPSPYMTSDEELVLTGLEPDSVVQVAVRAVVQLNGMNYYSDDVTNTQRTLVAEPGNIQVGDVTTTTVEITWIGLPGENTYYIDYFAEGGTSPSRKATSSTVYTLTDLSPGALYNISVVPAAGSYRPFSIIQRTKPASPTGISVTTRDKTFVSLDWENPPTAVNYSYMVLVSNPQRVEVTQMMVSASEVTVDGLTAATTYTFTLISLAGVGATMQVSDSENVTATTTLMELVVDEVGSSNVSLSWDPLNVDSMATMNLTYSSNEGTPNSIPLPSGSTGAMIRQLSPAGSNVSLSLILVNGGNQAEILGSNATTLLPLTVSDLSCTNGRTEINVRWNIEESLYDGFEVQYRPMDGRIDGSNFTTSFSRRIVGLVPGQEYMVTVTTIHMNMRSGSASCVVITRPEVISTLRAIDIGQGGINISWTLPSMPGIPISNFGLVVTPGGSELPVEPILLAPETTHFIYTGDTGLYYDIEVFSIVTGQQRVTMSESSYTSVLLAPAKVQFLVQSDEQIGATFAELRWRISGARSRFELRYVSERNGGGNTTIIESREESVTIEDLTPDTLYNVSIVAISEYQVIDGDLLESRSDPSRLTIETKLFPPRNLTTRFIRSTAIQWAWLPPADGANNFTYMVHVTPGNINEQVTTTSFDSTGLSGKSEYTIRVRSVIGSSTSSYVTHSATTLPSRPSIITGFGVPDGVEPTTEVTLVWTAPDPDEEVTMIQLKINGMQVSGNGEDIRVMEVVVTQTTLVVADLRPGYIYDFTLCATNEVGTSDPATEGPILIPETAPPFTQSRVIITSTTQTTLMVEIPNPFFSDENGPVVNYALLVTTLSGEVAIPVRPITYLQAQSSSSESVYQTTPSEFDPYPSSNRNGRYEVGADETCVPESNVPDFVHCNGPLKPSTSYRVALRGYSNEGSYRDSLWSEPAVTKFEIIYVVIICSLVVIVVVLVLLCFCCICCCCRSGESSPKKKRASRHRLHPVRDVARDVTSLEDFRLPSDHKPDVENGGRNSDSDDVFVPELTSYKRKTTLNKNRSKRYKKSKKASRSRQVGDHMASTSTVNTNTAVDDASSSVTTLVATSTSHPVIISRFPDHVASLSKGWGNGGFGDEFQAMKKVKIDLTKEDGNLPENRSKNRYKDILPYDFNRVKLTQIPPNGTDYINASNVKLFTWSSYIATQGPKPETLQDFWQMVWENRSTSIVMLSRVIERELRRCEKYWPEADETLTFGEFEVSGADVNSEENWKIRTLILKKNEVSMTITQFHFLTWPDHGVPQSTVPMLEFVREVRQKEAENLGPLLVHCSAGCGRTGTYIALDSLIKRVETSTMNEPIDVLDAVFSLRRQRMTMVQTPEQYAFLHQCLLTFIQEVFF